MALEECQRKRTEYDEYIPLSDRALKIKLVQYRYNTQNMTVFAVLICRIHDHSVSCTAGSFVFSIPVYLRILMKLPTSRDR